MHLFHQTDLNADVIELSTEEAHHATAVLRLAVGTTIGLMDGQGQRAEAELITVGKRGCTAQVISRTIHLRNGRTASTSPWHLRSKWTAWNGSWKRPWRWVWTALRP
ncbi:MAG: 16S rRNA (uracil(1498)-N(3))-methyltransferase [Flavobacteriales bacterium]|nr:16S rRNA (uracil(1498)-N(3))-methyltransferase [Flavobacteriales bacterium]